MKTEIVKQAQEIKVTRALEYVQVKEELYVFSYTETTKEEKIQLFSGKNKKTNRQGFILKKNLDAFINGKDLKTEDRYAVVNQEFIDKRRTSREDLFSSSNKAFDDYVKINGDNSFVIRDDYFNSHMMFDIDGNVLPVAIHCDYIDAHMSNASYDLEKALEILRKNPNVQFLDRRGNFTDPAIDEIPYYNVDGGRTHYLHFIFSPTKEQVNQMWKLQQTLKEKYPSTAKHEAIFELDILGLRKGGAAKFDTFLGEYSRDNSEE